MFQTTLDPIAGSLGLSALVACLPLITFFVLLVAVKAKAHVSAFGALVVALLVAIFGFNMPVDLALVSATQGAAFGAWPIVFIIVMAIWFYEVTVISGRSEDLRKLFDMIGGGDIRIQSALIAFCFGGLLESLAGFGAPIAITATMLIALGVKPSRAALAVLIANTAPVAFGAVSTPIITAGTMVSAGDAAVAAQTSAHVAALVGHQAPVFALIVPLLIMFVLDGTKGIKDCWMPALVIGLSFAVTQWWTSNHFAYELTDVIASLVSMGVLVVFMRFFKPRNVDEARARFGAKPLAEVGEQRIDARHIFFALIPYIIVVVVFAVGKLGIAAQLASTDIKIAWPLISGGAIVNALGNDPGTTFNLNLLSSPGTMLLVAGLLTALVYQAFPEGGTYKTSLWAAIREIGRTAVRMRWAGLTIVLVLSLAYVMNFSGQTISIGQFLAGSGPAFAFISPLLGWVGTAVTGSDTSANALFSNLQYTAANANPAYADIDPDLFLAANTMGGVTGKMISPQSLAIAAAASGEKESDLFKNVLPWSLLLLVGLSILVFLQAGVLNFLMP